MSVEPFQPLLLRLQEAADMLAVSKAHIERMIRRGEIGVVYVSTRRGVRVPVTEIERWLAAQTVHYGSTGKVGDDDGDSGGSEHGD